MVATLPTVGGDVGTWGDELNTYLIELAGRVTAVEVSGINFQSTNYTAVLSDTGKIIEMSSAGPLVLTIPTNATAAFSVGSGFTVVQAGVGQTTIAPAAGVTLRTPDTLVLAEQWALTSLYKRATNEWVLLGNLVAG